MSLSKLLHRLYASSVRERNFRKQLGPFTWDGSLETHPTLGLSEHARDKPILCKENEMSQSAEVLPGQCAFVLSWKVLAHRFRLLCPQSLLTGLQLLPAYSPHHASS